MAIAILGWPVDKLSTDAAQKVLEGGRHICTEAEIPLAGGHTIDSTDPIFGLAVTGNIHPKKIKKNNTAREGDYLFLTKPIGVGILATALKRGLLKDEHYKVLLQQMTALNKVGEALGNLEEVHAMTDVTGFGLLGHLIEMAEGSGLSVDLNYSAIKKIEGVDEYLKQRTIPDATFRNWNSYSNKVQFVQKDSLGEKGVNVMEAFNLLPDPQTNGGLLIAVAEDGINKIKEFFISNGLAEFTMPIGICHLKEEKLITVKN
jgi:selenide,water dikinase